MHRVPFARLGVGDPRVGDRCVGAQTRAQGRRARCHHGGEVDGVVAGDDPDGQVGARPLGERLDEGEQFRAASGEEHDVGALRAHVREDGPHVRGGHAGIVGLDWLEQHMCRIGVGAGERLAERLGVGVGGVGILDQQPTRGPGP